MNWADAHLTDVGIEQARTANRFWAEKIKHEKIPTPQSYYASPLDRCLATARTTFTGLDLPEDRPFRPSVKEVSLNIYYLYITYTDMHSFSERSTGYIPAIGAAQNPTSSQLILSLHSK